MTDIRFTVLDVQYRRRQQRWPSRYGSNRPVVVGVLSLTLRCRCGEEFTARPTERDDIIVECPACSTSGTISMNAIRAVK